MSDSLLVIVYILSSALIIVLLIALPSAAPAAERQTKFQWTQPMTVNMRVLNCDGNIWWNVAAETCNTHTRQITDVPETCSNVLYCGSFVPQICTSFGYGRRMQFNSGGTYEIRAGDIIVGANSGARGTVLGIDRTQMVGEVWTNGDVTGAIAYAPVSGTFLTGENLNIGEHSNVATIANAATVYGTYCAGTLENNPYPLRDLNRWELFCGNTTGGPYTLQKTVTPTAATTDIPLFGWTLDADGRYYTTLAAAPSGVKRSGTLLLERAFASKYQATGFYYKWFYSTSEQRLYIWSSSTPSDITYIPQSVTAEAIATLTGAGTQTYYCVIEAVRSNTARSGYSAEVNFTLTFEGRSSGTRALTYGGTVTAKGAGTVAAAGTAATVSGGSTGARGAANRTALGSAMTITGGNVVAVLPEPISITANRAASAITLDGGLTEWTGANFVTFSNPARSDNLVLVYVLWDDTNLYIAYDVTDTLLEATGAALWQDDGAEIFFDTNNDKSVSLDSNDYQIMTNINNLSSLSGVTVATATRTGGYRQEIQIPWSVIATVPSVGRTIGLLLANNDRDNGVGNQFDWAGLINSGWYSRPNLWGNLVLVGTNNASGMTALTYHGNATAQGAGSRAATGTVAIGADGSAAGSGGAQEAATGAAMTASGGDVNSGWMPQTYRPGLYRRRTW